MDKKDVKIELVDLDIYDSEPISEEKAKVSEKKEQIFDNPKALCKHIIQDTDLSQEDIYTTLLAKQEKELKSIKNMLIYFTIILTILIIISLVGYYKIYQLF